MNNTVYIVACPDYSQVEEQMKKLLDMMGGMSRFVKPGERIVLKPNLLVAKPPEKAATTHPAVVVAVGRMAQEEGAKVTLADSPGSGYAYNEKTLKRLYHQRPK